MRPVISALYINGMFLLFNYILFCYMYTFSGSLPPSFSLWAYFWKTVEGIIFLLWTYFYYRIARNVTGKRHSFFIANAFYSSFLFGLWHSIMPLRNFIDGDQSLAGAVFSALLLFGSSFLFSVQLGMQFKQANSSLWDGMVVHFINNASVNFLHVVYTDGTESNPTMRIAVAQTLIFIIVTVRWYLWRKQNPVMPVTRHQILHKGKSDPCGQ